MKNKNLYNEEADNQVYAHPVCEVIFMGTQRVICASDPDNEIVGEDEGEW